MIFRLLAPLTLTVVTLYAGQASAQGAFPGIEGWAASDRCKQEFAPLREEESKRARMIKAASERRAQADEVCKLIGDFSRAELRMINYLQTNASHCAVAPWRSELLKADHRNTEKMKIQICAIAGQRLQAPAGQTAIGLQPSRKEPAGPVGDFWLMR